MFFSSSSECTEHDKSQMRRFTYSFKIVVVVLNIYITIAKIFIKKDRKNK